MSRNIYNGKIIDGVEIIIHGKANVIESMKDLTIAPLFSTIGDERPDSIVNGISVNPTPATEELHPFDFQQRILTKYFIKTFTDWVGSDKDIDLAIDQMTKNVQTKEVTDLAFGRLFGRNQKLFAKLDLNKMWTLTMHNPVKDDPTLNDFMDSLPKKGIRGTWTFKPKGEDVLQAYLNPISGVFHLGTKDYVLRANAGGRASFKSPTLVAHASKRSFSDELSLEFEKRWGHVINGRMEFEFLSECIEPPLPNARQGATLSNEQYHVGEEIQLDPVRIETVADRRLQQLQPGVEIQVHGTVSTIDEVVPLDEATEAGTRVLIMSKADDGEMFLFLIGARQTDHNYTTGIPVANMLDVLLTV